MSGGRRVWFSLVVGVVLLRAMPAFAQWECPEASSPQQARRLAGQTFDEGEQLYRERRFQEAIDRFECSYSLVRHPNTLYNIARTAQEVGNLALALTTYRAYLEQHATDDDRATVERNIRDLEQRIAQQEQTGPPVDGSPVEDPNAGTPPPGHGAVPGGTGPVDTNASTRMTTARLMAWITLAVGVAATATGGGLWLGAWSAADDIPATVATGADLTQWEDEVESGQNMEMVSYILMGVGGAALVASIVLFAVFPGREPVAAASAAAPRLGLLAGDGAFGLTFSGVFEGL